MSWIEVDDRFEVRPVDPTVCLAGPWPGATPEVAAALDRVIEDMRTEYEAHPTRERKKALRRVELFREGGGRCYYCRRQTALLTPIRVVRTGPPGSNTYVVERRHTGHPRWMATLEHLIDRDHPLRGKVRGGLALACRQCNNRRGRETHMAVPLEERRRQARWPDAEPE